MSNDVIAERTLDYRDGETTRPITVRVYRPEERDSGWVCAIEVEGEREPGSLWSEELYGDDSAGALLLALDRARSVKIGGRSTYKGRNPWPVAIEPSDLIDITSATGLAADVVVERTLQDEKGGTVVFRVRKPVEHGPGDWSCVFEVLANDRPWTYELHGVDSAQALFGALSIAKTEAGVRRLSRDGHNPWEIRTEPLELLPWKKVTE